jgi:predicted RNase H-like HicB family nuclease
MRYDQEKVMKFLIVIERSAHNFAAYVPDLPGCVATGTTREETVRAMQLAIEMHIQAMREDEQPIPTPSADAEYLIVT